METDFGSMFLGGAGDSLLTGMTLDRLLSALETSDNFANLPALPPRMRAACPDILDFLKDSVRIPIAQRKNIQIVFEAFLDREVDIRNNDEFFTAFLDLLETSPHFLHVFMFAAAPATGRHIKRSVRREEESFLVSLYGAFAPTKLAIKTHPLCDSILEKARGGGRMLEPRDIIGLFFLYALDIGERDRQEVRTLVVQAGLFAEDDLAEDMPEDTEAWPQADIDASFRDIPDHPARALLRIAGGKITGSEEERAHLADALAHFTEVFRSGDAVSGSMGILLLATAIIDWKNLQDEHRDNSGLAGRIEAILGPSMTRRVVPAGTEDRLEALCAAIESADSNLAAVPGRMTAHEADLDAARQAKDWALLQEISGKMAGLDKEADRLRSDRDAALAEMRELLGDGAGAGDAPAGGAADEISGTAGAAGNTIPDRVPGGDTEIQSGEEVGECAPEGVPEGGGAEAGAAGETAMPSREALEADPAGEDLPAGGGGSEATESATGGADAEPVAIPEPGPGAGSTIAPSVLRDIDDTSLASVFAELVRDDRLAIAARAAGALDRFGVVPALPEQSLHLAAAARIPFESYDSSTTRVQSLMIPAEQADGDNPHAGALMLGALLRPAVLVPATMARETIGRLSLGSYAASVGDFAQALAEVDFSFNPTLQDLAKLSGRPAMARRPRVEKALFEWMETTAMRQGPCQPSTAIIHKFVKPSGEFGALIRKIRNGDVAKAEAAAREVIARFETQEMINARVREINPGSGTQYQSRFPTITMQYIYRRMGEGRDLLTQWLDALAEERGRPGGNADQQKRIVSQLVTRARAAREALCAQGREAVGEPLEAAICAWLDARFSEFLGLLEGHLPAIWPDYDSAVHDELDLLPIRTGDGEGVVDRFDEGLIEFLLRRSVPGAFQAIDEHIEVGAFRRAARLLSRIEDETLREETRARIDAVRTGRIDETLEALRVAARALREVGKIDLRRPEEIQREISRLDAIAENLRDDREMKLEALSTSPASNLPSDLDEIMELVTRTHDLVHEIRQDILDDQRQRLEAAREAKPQMAAEIDALIARLPEMTLENAEDQIAHIRDDRAVGQLSVALTGPFEDFFPGFIEAAGEADWPGGLPEYRAAFAAGGPLAVEDDRRDASGDLMEAWFDLAHAVALGNATAAPLKNLLQSLSFLNVAPRKGTQIQGHKAWRHEVSMNVSQSGDWFCPPVFGSRSADHYQVVVMHPSVLLEQIQPVLKTDIPTLILVAGRMTVARRRDMAQRLRDTGLPALVIDELTAAFVAIRSEDRLAVLFDCSLPFGRVEPYITDAGKLPREMFFGRREEIEKIVGRDSEGILVYGGRQLGKSALLAQVEELHHDPKNGRIVIREDVKSLGGARQAGEIWSIIADKLRPDGVVAQKSSGRDAVIADIKRWLMERPGRQVLVLLDETDSFLAYEAKNDFPNLMHIKGLMEDTNRAFKTVFAGLHHVQRMFKSSNSPLAHFGSAICVGPLNNTHDDREAAYRLVVEPMRAAGFRFADDSAPDEILSYVNHYPSLVQVYAKELLRHLHARRDSAQGGPLWEIPRDILFEGQGFEAILAGIRKKFGYTLDLDPRYKLIAYVLGFLKWQGQDAEVLHEGLQARAILEATAEYWPDQLEPIPLSDMQTILDEMFELGILGKIEHDHLPPTYCLRTRQVANMLGTESEITEELIALQDVEPPHDYNPSTNRRVLRGARAAMPWRDARHFSPLTDGQLARLLKDQGDPGARVVAGTRLLGCETVPAAIRDYAETLGTPPGGKRISVEIATTQKDYADRLRQEPGTRREMKVVVFQPAATEVEKVLHFTDERASVRSGKVRPILVLDAAVPALREIAITRRAEALRPWGTEMLRTYLGLIEEMPLDRKDILDAILDRTGGIPARLIALVADLRNADDFLEHLSAVPPADVSEADGFDAEMTRAARILAEVLDLADRSVPDAQVYDLANEEILGATGKDLVSLGPDLEMTGILDRFNPAQRSFRITRLGMFLAQAASRGVG
ncbi:hypothetical protein [Rhodovulum steppense]|uniref:Uncharacterized protein n=1 Tax=Rhodovulum steppense TaxID=540251 RepID=A0A4R1YGF3_9RHOB|nr:hypothetical protein [Rhodovulum steppense]TCM75231.1 hypothetical protein EV216_1424 [Rhodovulum steppense]